MDPRWPKPNGPSARRIGGGTECRPRPGWGAERGRGLLACRAPQRAASSRSAEPLLIANPDIEARGLCRVGFENLERYERGAEEVGSGAGDDATPYGNHEFDDGNPLGSRDRVLGQDRPAIYERDLE